MGVNAPAHPVLPDAIQGTTLTVDGETIDVRGTTGVPAHRPYVWIPSLKAIVEAEAAKAANGAALSDAMNAAYPQLGPSMALDLGAKVIKGEMQW